MNTLRNHVQLIGNLGHKPTIKTTENGRKMARFTLATNLYYKTAKGEQKQETNWHNIVAWGRTAEVVEQYVAKGQEIGVSGKLNTRAYKDNHGKKRYFTEVVADEILLLGTQNAND